MRIQMRRLVAAGSMLLSVAMVFTACAKQQGSTAESKAPTETPPSLLDGSWTPPPVTKAG